MAANEHRDIPIAPDGNTYVTIKERLGSERPELEIMKWTDKPFSLDPLWSQRVLTSDGSFAISRHKVVSSNFPLPHPDQKAR